MAGDRRGSQIQESGTKTEAVICPGEQDRATQDQHRHHRTGRRGRGTKGPKSRSSSLARVSASATPTPKHQDDSKFFIRKTRSDSTSATGPREQNNSFVTESQHPRAQASGARRRLRSTIPPSRYNLWQIGTARTSDDALPQADQETLTAPTGHNGLPCDLSRVGRAGTVKPANRGAREVPKHNVTTMTKAKDTAPAPGRRATENPSGQESQVIARLTASGHASDSGERATASSHAAHPSGQGKTRTLMARPGAVNRPPPVTP